MRVTEKDVACVAELADLELTADERSRLLRDLNSILDYIDRLNELDTSNVPPLAQISGHLDESGAKPDDRFACVVRDDVPQGLRKSLPREAALANAPHSDGVFFKVPKVIER